MTRIERRLPEVELRDALHRFVDEHFHNSGQEPPRISIPANPERDDDLMLSSALDELETLRVQSARAAEKAPETTEPAPPDIPLSAGSDTAWPVRECLRRLADAGEHLLRDHDCDTHGWEGIGLAVQSARGLLATEPARLDADRTAKPRTVLVAHASVKTGAMVAHDNEIERYELRDTTEPTSPAGLASPAPVVEGPIVAGHCELCGRDTLRGETVAGYGDGSGNRFVHIGCYHTAKRLRESTPACERCGRLEAALATAVDFAAEGWSYANDFFRTKHRYGERMAKLAVALAFPAPKPAEKP